MRRSLACRGGSALLVLAVSILLALPAAASARSSWSAAPPASGSAVSLEGRLVVWLSELWLRASGWEKNGCYIDPDGKCSTATATPDNGCGIDPGGRCGH